jgi:transcriptional regulator with XRE-family HTH domain
MYGHLKRFREIRALSRKDLAQRSHVNASTIYRAERGQTRLRPSTVRKLAQALGVPPDELLNEQGRLVL